MPGVEYEWNSGLKYFFLFLSLSHPSLNGNNAGMMFFNFLNFFAIFFLEYSCPGWIGTEFGTKFFFFLFLGLSQPGLDRNNAGILFVKFLQFFLEFCNPSRVGTKFRAKIFVLFLGLSHPGLDRNNPKMKFFNISNFFAIFFGIL